MKLAQKYPCMLSRVAAPRHTSIYQKAHFRSPLDQILRQVTSPGNDGAHCSRVHFLFAHLPAIPRVTNYKYLASRLRSDNHSGVVYTSNVDAIVFSLNEDESGIEVSYLKASWYMHYVGVRFNAFRVICPVLRNNSGQCFTELESYRKVLKGLASRCFEGKEKNSIFSEIGQAEFPETKLSKLELKILFTYFG